MSYWCDDEALNRTQRRLDAEQLRARSAMLKRDAVAPAAQSCLTCRHWDGKPKYWEEPGEARGACTFLRTLSPAPAWIVENPPVRVTYDNDGAECATFALKES